MTYTNNQGEDERPYVLHRALFGSFERFIALLIEHYAGAFPTWLSPVQAMIIPISEEKFGDYARLVETQLLASGIRVKVDASAESLSKRIRNAEKEKIPYMLVVGEKEMESKSLAIRPRGTKDQTVMKINEFVEKIMTEIKGKK